MSNIYANGSYFSKNQTWHQEDSGHKFKLVSDAITETGTQFESCVDVGCGAGKVAELLAQRYSAAKLFGYDVSTDVSSLWADKPSVTFRNADLLATSDKFDLALCLDVFEHVEDYIGFLRKLRRHAKRFVFNIPLDMNVVKMVTGLRPEREQVGHLHYFNPYTALATLEYCGYKPLRVHYDNAYMMHGPRTLRQAVALVPRTLVSAVSRRWAASLTGGYSMVVTAD